VIFLPRHQKWTLIPYTHSLLPPLEREFQSIYSCYDKQYGQIITDFKLPSPVYWKKKATTQ